MVEEEKKQQKRDGNIIHSKWDCSIERGKTDIKNVQLGVVYLYCCLLYAVFIPESAEVSDSFRVAGLPVLKLIF